MSFFLSPASVFVLGGLFLLGAFGALALPRVISERFAGIWSYGWGIAGSLVGLLIAFSVIASGQWIAFDAGNLTALISFSLRVDALSAFFLGVISLVSLFVSVYALSYQEHFAGHYPLGVLGAFYSIFVASMLFVVLANHALTFLFFWEVMSLSSYLLVIYEHREKKNLQAGFLYFIMMHIATVFIFIAFLLAFATTGSMHFDAWRASLVSAAPLIQGAILAAALVGFGIKAGMVPLHIWLPEAHPAAPSHVSALMSGVMIKTAIFMLIRFFFDFLPGSSALWGVAILFFGVIASIFGVLYALSEHDIKRLLAYHSVENIGIILLGIGSAVIFAEGGMPGIALIALTAALFHTVNHALFKALLFLGAGSVVSATGTRNMEEYGGLIKLLPYTAAFFLTGSLAIAAFPPLNGFASEWLTFQALLAGLASASPFIKMSFMVATAGLVLTGGLAAAAFVKAFALPFLGRSRSRAPEQNTIREASRPMLLGMAGLAALAVLFGVFAVPVSNTIMKIASSLGRFPSAAFAFPGADAASPFENMTGMVALLSVSIAFFAVALLVYGAVFFITRRNKITYGATWSCGVPLSPRMEITATGFSRSLTLVFKGILRPTRQVSAEYHDESSRYFVKSSAISVGFADPYRTRFYGPVHEALLFIASRVRRIQSGNINLYVVYVFATVIALLVFATAG